MGLELDIGLALFSALDGNGFLTIQPDAYGEQKSGMAPCETHHPLGMIARPLDPVVDKGGTPDPTQAAQLLRLDEEGKSHVLALEDPRAVANLPPIQKGESVVYNCFAQFVRLAADGSVTLFTTSDGTTNGQSVYQRVETGAFKQVAPWGTATFDWSGWHVQTKAGGRFSLTGIAGLPAPFSAMLASCALLEAQTIVLEGTVQLGAGEGQLPVALATPLLAYLAQMATALQDIATAVKALATTPVTTSAGPATPLYANPAVALLVDKMSADLVPVMAPPTKLQAQQVFAL